MEAMKKFEEYLKSITNTKEKLTIDEMEVYLESHKLTTNQMIEVFKDLKEVNRDVFTYGLTLLGRLGVLESIYEKASSLASQPLATFDFPREGLPIKDLPEYADKMTCFLKEKIGEEAFEALADNHHRIPDEAFQKEKEYFLESESLEAYLKERHGRKVAELQDYCDRDALWYEQTITQEVVDLVKDHQEMLSAELKDNNLYVTKIPYDTVEYLHGETDVDKRHAYCHCGMARDSIKSGQKVDGDWCYCSAGFAKKPFEVILDRKLDIEVLESVLKGDMRCRFRIPL